MSPAPPHPERIDPLEFQVLNEIGIIDQLAQHRAAALLAPALNMSKFIVLNHLARLGGEHSLMALTSAIQVTKGAMSNTVSRLHGAGLVAVRPDPQDGRGKLVSLNAAGRDARDDAVARLGHELAALRGVLSQAELRVTLTRLRKLRMWFDAHR